MPEIPTNERRFADVALNLPLHRTFHYSVPERLRGEIAVGKRVEVPFRSLTLVGYCVGFVERPEVAEVKEILEVVDAEPLVDERLLKLARWMAEYYCAGLGEALETVLPAAVRHDAHGRRVRIVELAMPPDEAAGLAVRIRRREKAKARILETLRLGQGELTPYELAQAAGVSICTIDKAAEQGYIRYVLREVSDPFTVEVARTAPPELTEEQREALALIEKRIDEGAFRTILIHGVTGSGKTELYLRACERVVKNGKQAIVLVPEISLTPQTIARFKARFERLAVLHSRLSPGQRHAQWQSIRRGEVQVIVGARSALFAPTPATGLIVVDEEHETSYKQDASPRYHARDLAVVRGELEGIVVLLGSATPSLESFHNARTGKYDLVCLTRRIEERAMPSVSIVDMSAECRRGYHPISTPLKEAAGRALRLGEQVILFQNRRGFSPYVQCLQCGYTFKCTTCDVALTLHKKSQRLQCHYCHRDFAVPEKCPDCQGRRLWNRGAGTERVEEAIEDAFGAFPIARMDSDTMTTREAYEKVLGDFAERKIRVLVGTQMIAKGLDFPHVTVVGVISADALLNVPDFRSAERTFQLISQVAGRAGRGERPGQVIVQCFRPGHYSIQFAIAHDYHGFVERELELRQELSYPPYTRLVRVLCEARSAEKAYRKVSQIAEALRETAWNHGVQQLGPAAAPIGRLRTWYRWHLIYKAPSARAVRYIVRTLRPFLSADQRLRVIVDVDPVSML